MKRFHESNTEVLLLYYFILFKKIVKLRNRRSIYLLLWIFLFSFFLRRLSAAPYIETDFLRHLFQFMSNEELCNFVFVTWSLRLKVSRKNSAPCAARTKIHTQILQTLRHMPFETVFTAKNYITSFERGSINNVKYHNSKWSKIPLLWGLLFFFLSLHHRNLFPRKIM